MEAKRTWQPRCVKESLGSAPEAIDVLCNEESLDKKHRSTGLPSERVLATRSERSPCEAQAVRLSSPERRGSDGNKPPCSQGSGALVTRATETASLAKAGHV